MHRGSVRLQLKVFNNHTGAVSSNADKDDFKVFDCSVLFFFFGSWHFSLIDCCYIVIDSEGSFPFVCSMALWNAQMQSHCHEQMAGKC